MPKSPEEMMAAIGSAVPAGKFNELVAAQYGGKKAARQTYVSFKRGRQFAIVRATTQTTADVGLVLPGCLRRACGQASG